MKELDLMGSTLCSFQAKIFAQSRDRFDCSSKMFIRRFFYSNYSLNLDYYQYFKTSYDEEECYEDLLEEFGDSTYGRVKLPKKVLHYVGYISRYICYTRNVTSLFFYHHFHVDELIKHYEVYHTQSEEYVIRDLLEIHGFTEDIFDEEKLLKDLLLERYK